MSHVYTLELRPADKSVALLVDSQARRRAKGVRKKEHLKCKVKEKKRACKRECGMKGKGHINRAHCMSSFFSRRLLSKRGGGLTKQKKQKKVARRGSLLRDFEPGLGTSDPLYGVRPHLALRLSSFVCSPLARCARRL